MSSAGLEEEAAVRAKGDLVGVGGLGRFLADEPRVDGTGLTVEGGENDEGTSIDS